MFAKCKKYPSVDWALLSQFAKCHCSCADSLHPTLCMVTLLPAILQIASAACTEYLACCGPCNAYYQHWHVSVPCFSTFNAALPPIPGQRKKAGRPSKADLAAREAFWAAQEAAEAEAAAGQAAGTAAAETIALPTTALDPPAQQSATTAPAAVLQNAARAAASKLQAKQPTVAAAAASEQTGDNSTLGPQVPNSRPAAGDAQKPGVALPASCASLTGDKQGTQRRAITTPADDDDNDDSSYLPDEAAAPAANSRRLKRLRKQPSNAGTNKKKPAAEHALKEDEAALAQNAAAHVVPSHGSGLSLELPVSTGGLAQVEVFVDAVGASLEQADAGCARARPWLKHLQQAAEEAHAAAEEAAKHKEATIAPTDGPAPAAAVAKDATAVPANQDSVGQVGSGGSDEAAVAGPPGAKEEIHKRGTPKQGRLAPAKAQQPQQQDQHSQVQREHAPRGSRTSPHSPPTLPTVEPKQADSRTGTSQPRGGTSLPINTPPSRNANATHNRQLHHGQADDVSQEAQASPSGDARSGESSDNASVQHGVGHTGESSEALPASMRSSKPEVQVQRQQQQQQQPPTSSVSEQGLHSAAGNAKPGAALPPCWPYRLCNLGGCNPVLRLRQMSLGQM